MTPSPAPADTTLAQVRDLLLTSGYTASGLQDRLTPPALAALSLGIGAVAARELQGSADAQALLIQTFQLAAPTRETDWVKALGHEAVLLCDRAGLITVADGVVLAQLAVDPVVAMGDPYLVHDLGLPDQPDHVLGLGGAGATLARVTPRRPCRAALDVGCGSGIQTLHAAQHAQIVVATDTNPRALRLTAMSAALSQVTQERLDLRMGSLYEPVAGETFDLVVANPPFVISPDRRFTYRDAGLPGDQLSRDVVRGAANHLAPGGLATVLVNWLVGPGEDWSERVSGWVSDLEVSAWIVARQMSSVLDYSLLWLRDAGIDPAQAGNAGTGAELTRWLRYFAELPASAVCFGWVMLHRPLTPDDPTWLLAEDLSRADRLPDGHEVAAYLAAGDQVERRGVAERLAGPAQLKPGTTISWQATVGTASPPVPSLPAQLTRPGAIGPGGWHPAVPIDQAVLSALLGPDRQPIGERIDQAAAELGLDPLEVLPSALFTLRELDRVGLLVDPHS